MKSNLVKRGRSVAFAFFCGVLTVNGAVTIRHYEATNVVTSAAETFSGVLRTEALADGVLKTGAGAFTLPRGNVVAADTVRLNVLNGKLSLTDSPATAVPVTPPAVIYNKAALWLEAGTHVVPKGDDASKVARWYDVRETADASSGTWGAAYGAADSGTTAYPSVVNKAAASGSLPMMYFNGANSDTYMRLLNTARTGAEYTVRHAFAVLKIENAYGFVFGGFQTTEPVFLAPTATGGAATGYYSDTLSSMLVSSSKFHLNGRVCNPAVTPVAQGFQLIEMECDARVGLVETIFRNNSNAGRQGGDYLGEYILFTRKLSPAEHLDVEHYLLAKWIGQPTVPEWRVAVAPEAAFDFGSVGSLLLSGTGIMRHTGADAMVFPAGSSPDFKGTFAQSVDAGSLSFERGEPRVALARGERLTASHAATGATTLSSVSDGALAEADAAGVTGTGTLRLTGLDPETRKLEAEAFEVVLDTPERTSSAAPSGEIFATIVNGDGEQYFQENPGAGTKWFSTDQPSGVFCGWTYSTVGLFGFIRTDNEVNANSWYFNAKDAGEDTDCFKSLDGVGCIALKMDTTATTDVTVPADGDYEFSYYGTARKGSENGRLCVALTDTDGTVVHEIAKHSLRRWLGWRPYRFLVRNVKKGSYRLRLVFDTAGQDKMGFVDALKMRLVRPAAFGPETCAVPNGSFESMNGTIANAALFTPANTATGWTLTQGAVGSAATADNVGNYDIGFASRWSRISSGKFDCAFFNSSARYGESQLNLRSCDGYAETAEFTVPAGTWRLRFTAANASFTDGAEVNASKWNGVYANRPPTFAATVYVNGNPVSLGASADITSYVMADYALGTTFTVSAGDAVKLRVWQGKAYTTAYNGAVMLALDEVWFERTDGAGTREYVSNGSFETQGSATTEAVGWTMDANKGDGSDGNLSYSNAVRINPLEWYLGTTVCDGSWALALVDIGSAAQKIEFDEPGIYRLSFKVRTRVQNGSSVGSGGNRVKAWLVDPSGATNEIFRTESIYCTNFLEHVAHFRIPKAGQYTLGLQGCNRNPSAPTTSPAAKDKWAVVDLVSVKRASEADLVAPALHEDLELNLTASTRLRLDFLGTNKVGRVRLGGKAVSGFIDANHDSGLVTGTGCLYVEPRGMMILFR